MKKITYLLAFLLIIQLSSKVTYAQLSDIGDLIKGGVSDANLLTKAYISPYAKALAENLNSGWYNTAKPHKLLGFDITFSASASIIPSSDKTFNITALNLQNLRLVDPAKNMSPTAAGSKGDGPALTCQPSSTTSVTFNAPGGTGFGFLPSPMIKVGIGLIKGTDLSIRYTPKIKIGEAGSLGVWGIGIKHSIMQWLPIVDRVPFLNLSVFGGYSSISASADINYSVPTSTSPSAPVLSVPKNQKFDLKVGGYNINLIASVDIPIITVYASAGMASGKSTFKLLGDYAIYENSGTATPKGTVLKDPLNFSVDNKAKFVLTGGLKFKLGFFQIFGDYRISNYNIGTAGIAFNFR
jgi:hypothetical protein